MRRHGRDFAIALAACVCLQLVSNLYLLKGRVTTFGPPPRPNYETIQQLWEMAYQSIPARWTSTGMIRAGILPSWTPYAQGGTPFIGKMQNGIFYPVHLIYYLSPARWLPWAMTLAPLLSQVLSFSSLYLFARLAGLALIPAVLASCAMAFSIWASPLSPDPVTGHFFPLLLLLAELFVRGRHRRLALWLLPIPVALSFYGGHFETAARCVAMANLYLLLRTFDQPGNRAARLKLVLPFVAAQLPGLAMALPVIAAGSEYVRWSYNLIWRTRPEFGYVYETINKRLVAGDAPLLLAGLAALAASVYLVREVLREPRGLRLAACTAGGAASVALAVGALARIGLDDSAHLLIRTSLMSFIGAAQYSAVFALFAAAYAALFVELSPPLKAVRALLVVACLIRLKLPILSNLLANLPITKLFGNTHTSMELVVALSTLAAAAIQQLPAEDLRKRLASLGRFALVGVVVVGGWTLAWALKPVFCRLTTTGTYDPYTGNDGAFFGPEMSWAWLGSRYPVRGWSAFPCQAVKIVAMSGDREPLASVDAEPGRSGDRCSFYGVLDLPRYGEYDLTARVAMPNGFTQTIRGPHVSVTAGFPGLPLLAAAAGTGAAALVPAAGPVIFAGAVAAWVAVQAPESQDAEDFPFRLPGIEKLRADPSPFRVDSFQYAFLQADYASMYGLSDLRVGGDNLDVLPAVYFRFLLDSLASAHDGSPLQALALRLRGLANVKYILDAPASRHSSPYLEEFYRGPDMVVYKNKLAMPRAAFFDQAVELLIPDILDWNGSRRACAALPGLLQAPDFDPQRRLILHDPAPLPPDAAPGRKAGPRPPVEVASYQPDRVVLTVDAPRAGYVFLADNHFPGWEATVNGEPAPILRALLTFRAVQVAAGRSTIEFVYKPWPLSIGLLVACLSVLAWLLLFLYRWPSIPDATAPDGADVEAWSARAARGLLLGLVLAPACYWAYWTLFLYRCGR